MIDLVDPKRRVVGGAAEGVRVESGAEYDELAGAGAIGGREPVFRVQAAVDKDRLHIDPAPPSRAWKLCLPDAAWRDLSAAQAEVAVMNGESLLVLGIAGTGKLHACLLHGAVDGVEAAPAAGGLAAHRPLPAGGLPGAELDLEPPALRLDARPAVRFSIRAISRRADI